MVSSIVNERNRVEPIIHNDRDMMDISSNNNLRSNSIPVNETSSSSSQSSADQDHKEVSISSKDHL